VPDTMESWSRGEPVNIRNPQATRPWQHVLEPLSGYLWLGAKLWEKDPRVIGEAFNFGPDDKVNQTVEQLLITMAKHWPKANWHIENTENKQQRESNLLKLCCDKALNILNWRAILSFEETVAMTTEWYKEFYKSGGDRMINLAICQIEEYANLAKKENILWIH